MTSQPKVSYLGDEKSIPKAIPQTRRKSHLLILLAALLITLAVFNLPVPVPCTRPHQSKTVQNAAKQDAKPSESWHRYVRASPSKTVYPARIHSVYGNVTNPHALLPRGPSSSRKSGRGKATVLSRKDRNDDVPAIVVDFGINTVGLLVIEFEGSSGGGNESLPGIRLAFSETLRHLSDTSDFSRSFNAYKASDRLTPGTDQIAVPEKPFTWVDQLGCMHGKKVCADGLHGFRYVKIYLDALPRDRPYTVPHGEVSIKSVSLRLSAFHGTPDTFTGWFECSDEDLTQWWFDGVYTNDLCIDEFRANDTEPRYADSPSLLGKLVIHDAPKRDRDPYSGDVAVAGLTTYLSHDASEAARNVLADLADHQREDGFIPPASIFEYTLHLFDYSLWWVVCSYDYVMHTGNVTYIEAYYSTLTSVLDNLYPSLTNPQTYLVEKGRRFTGGYGDYAFLPRSGPVTYYNALYVMALKDAASLATLLSRHGDASRWTDRAQHVAGAVNRYNFDFSVGAYYDGTCGTQYCETHAQDGNSIAVLAGIADKETARNALQYYEKIAARDWGNSFYDNDLLGRDHTDRVYAFISFFEISARFETGLVASALNETRRLYGWMSQHDPGVTFWEGTGRWYESDSFHSMAHGWATGIVPLMTKYVLGVRPTSPGYKTWEVRPHIGDLKWARGVVPTPGDESGIRVDWRLDPKTGRFEMDVRAPARLAMGGTIWVPAALTDQVVVNGVLDSRVSEMVRDEGGYVMVVVSEPSITIAVERRAGMEL